jgi:C4-type Zn-finger protein
MPKLTDEQKRDYIANKGITCPFCVSYMIVGNAVDFTDSGLMQEISCDECSARWTDIYTLTAVVEDLI